MSENPKRVSENLSLFGAVTSPSQKLTVKTPTSKHTRRPNPASQDGDRKATLPPHASMVSKPTPDTPRVPSPFLSSRTPEFRRRRKPSPSSPAHGLRRCQSLYNVTSNTLQVAKSVRRNVRYGASGSSLRRLSYMYLSDGSFLLPQFFQNNQGIFVFYFIRKKSKLLGNPNRGGESKIQI